MNDKDLIKTLKGLNDIKPSQNWVASVKKDIIGEGSRSTVFEVLQSSIFGHKLTYATISLSAILIGLFGISSIATPGDLLFPIRKMTEQSQASLLSITNQPKYNLEVVNKRLEDLVSIIKENKTDNVALAVQEVRESISNAAEAIAQNNPRSTEDIKRIAGQVRQMQETKANAETLGVIIQNSQESEQFDNALKTLVEAEIASLEKSTLTEKQIEILDQIEDFYSKGGYSGALEMILMIDVVK